MKRMIFPFAVMAFLGLTFYACDYEEDTSKLTVYLSGDNLSSDEIKEFSKKLDEAEALVKEHEEEAESYIWNEKNPDYRFGELEPDTFLQTKAGYVGLVDLGLSKKWACVNVGGAIPQQKPKTSLKEYFDVDKKPDINDLTSGLSMTYKEYTEGHFISSIREIIDRYLTGAQFYAYNYRSYAEGYYATANVKYLFATGGFDCFVVWGYPEMWKPNATTVASQTLRPEYDAATQLWGPEWATPSRADLEELVTKCKLSYLAFNGQEGVEVTGPNGKAIWLPVLGAKDPSGKIVNSGVGYYLSNEKEIQNTLLHAYVLGCNSKGGKVRTQPGDYGYCVRPVYK